MRRNSGYTKLLNILELANRSYLLLAYAFVSLALLSILFQTSIFLALETRLLALLTLGTEAFLILVMIEVLSLLVISKIEKSDAHVQHTIGTRIAEIGIQLIIISPVLMYELFGLNIDNVFLSFMASNMIPLVIIAVLFHASYSAFIQSEYRDHLWF